MGDIEREAKEVPFDFTGNTKLLINLIEGCSSHSKQDDWKEKKRIHIQTGQLSGSCKNLD